MGEDEADGTARGQSGSEVLASAKLAATSHVLAIIVWAFFSGTWWSKHIIWHYQHDRTSWYFYLSKFGKHNSSDMSRWKIDNWNPNRDIFRSSVENSLSDLFGVSTWCYFVLVASQAFWSSQSIVGFQKWKKCRISFYYFISAGLNIPGKQCTQCTDAQGTQMHR